MVAGHLREKRAIFYAVLNYTDAHGNRKNKVDRNRACGQKGNKKRAEAFLTGAAQFQAKMCRLRRSFADFMEQHMAKEFRGGDNLASYPIWLANAGQRTADCIGELSAKHIQDFLSGRNWNV